jgi:hypothetical protein
MKPNCTTDRVRSPHFGIATLVFALLFLCINVTSTLAQTTPVITDGWVVLPVDEYRALRRAAFPLDTDPAPPPVEATLSRIDYDLKVDGDLASGEARLTVDVIQEGWVRLAMPKGLMVREATLDGRQVTLVAPSADKGAGELLLSKTGRSVLTLKIVAPVSTVAGTDLLQLPASNSAVVRAAVEVARQGVDVRITGGLLMDHADTTAGSRWIANGRGTEPLTFAWRRRIDEARSLQPLRLRGAVSQLVGLGEDSTQISAEIQIDVLQGTAQEVRLQLPDGFIVNQVSGATVTDWETKQRELIVVFIEPVQQTARFTLSGELRLPRSGKLDVPLIRLPAAERETGGIAVEVLGAGEIKERQANGLEEAEAAELGQLISSRQSPSLVAFRFPPAEGKSTRSLSIGVARYTPQAVLTANIEEANYSTLITNDGKMLVQSRFAVRNNQRNFLKINLPASAVLWSASVAGRPIRPGRAPDGSLLLPLEKMKSGDEAAAFIVEIAYMDQTAPWADKGRVRLSLVSVDLPISKSQLLVHHSPIFRLTTPPGLTGSFRVVPPSESQGLLRLAELAPGIATSNEPTSTPTETVSEGTRELVSKLRDTKRGNTPTRNLPLRVAFPHFGPSLFLMSELTSENQTPVIDLDYQRDKKRGVQ